MREIKFLNLETGYSFDGLWNETQKKGYIFWFPKEQSINLTYTMPIAFISDSQNPINISIENNDIFSFITLNSTTTETLVDGYKFDGIPHYSNTTETIVSEVNNKYIHYFNIACKSDNAGEYICRMNIGDKGYIRVGADFYGENEPLYINLSNMGIELSTYVQKAIYDANVHEDLKDDILINRKFKELLSNYWDIIANKGSYKSLLNSLEWFEWDDQLSIKEIYKYSIADKTFYLDKNIATELSSDINNYTDNLLKTNYISLYCALQNELPTYDSEYNPELANVVFKWSKNDIQLKIALLAKFFRLNFLPIHLSILHATTEDKVFTNTIKNIHANGITREDNIGSFETVESNIKNNECFVISNVKAQVTNKTKFGVRYPNGINLETEKLEYAFGVDEFPSIGTVTAADDDIKTFSAQYYTGPGAIIPIKLTLTNIKESEFVKETIIDYTDDSDNYQHLNFYNIFSPKPNENKIEISFNFLAKSVKKYILNFTFILSSSKTLTKQIVFNVEDIDNVNINVYKVQAKNDTNGFSYEDFNTIGTSNKYLLSIQPNDNKQTYYTQYLPYLGSTYWNNDSYTGIKLNKTIIVQTIGTQFDIDEYINSITIGSDFITGTGLEFITNNFLYFYKKETETTETETTDKITYITFISKRFGDNVIKVEKNEKEVEVNVENELLNRLNNVVLNSVGTGLVQKGSNGESIHKALKIIRNDYGFYPQFHNLVKIEGTSLEDYTVKPYEALCAAAEISLGSETMLFKYGHLIDKAEWTFYNHLTNETITHPASSQVPFVAGTKNILEQGYYGISFNYSLNNGITKENKLDSAFRIKE